MSGRGGRMRVEVCLLTCVTVVATCALPADGFAQTRNPGGALAVAESDSDGVDVAGVLADSLKLLMWEHGTRLLFQPGTRAELGGPFWSDYRRSVRVPRQWEDTDPWLLNYIGHPIHGAAAGFVWIEH